MEDMISSVQEILERSEVSPANDEAQDRKGVSRSFFKGVTRELFSIKRHFEDILNQISEGMIEMTSNGRIIYANPSAISIVGIPEEKLLGAYFVDLLNEKDAEMIGLFFENRKSHHRATPMDCQLSLNNRQIVLNSLPLGDDQSSLLVILNDVSDRKRAEKALRESERMKGVLEMAGAVCHELNQPLQSILWYFELLSQIQRMISIRKLFPTRISGLTYEPNWFAEQIAFLLMPWLFTAVFSGYTVFNWRTRWRWLSVELILLGWSTIVLIFTFSRTGMILLGLQLILVFLFRPKSRQDSDVQDRRASMRLVRLS